MPDWFSWANEGAGIAVADVSGSGRPDLVVMMIDGVPGGANAGYYRIGWDLDEAGEPSSWGPAPHIDPDECWNIPDAFPHNETDGADIAVDDIDGNGAPDMVVFWINDRSGTNEGWVRIGWDMSPSTGRATSWSQDVRVWRQTDIFEHSQYLTAGDNSGAGVAIRNRAIPGNNRAKVRHSRAVPPSGTTAHTGKWVVVFGTQSQHAGGLVPPACFVPGRPLRGVIPAGASTTIPTAI